MNPASTQPMARAAARLTTCRQTSPQAQIIPRTECECRVRAYGCSSLRHLQLMPFDKLKIDQSFIGAMVAHKERAKIDSAVVGLGLSMVAEGVEAGEVAALLRGLGCDFGQGWLFGRPVPAHRIDALVALPTEPPDTARVLVA